MGGCSRLLLASLTVCLGGAGALELRASAAGAALEAGPRQSDTDNWAADPDEAEPRKKRHHKRRLEDRQGKKHAKRSKEREEEQRAWEISNLKVQLSRGTSRRKSTNDARSEGAEAEASDAQLKHGSGRRRGVSRKKTWWHEEHSKVAGGDEADFLAEVENSESSRRQGAIRYTLPATLRSKSADVVVAFRKSTLTPRNPKKARDIPAKDSKRLARPKGRPKLKADKAAPAAARGRPKRAAVKLVGPKGDRRRQEPKAAPGDAKGAKLESSGTAVVSEADLPAVVRRRKPEPKPISREMCMLEVKDGEQKCKFLSQKLCQGIHGTPNDLQGAHKECLAPKKSCALVGSSGHLVGSNSGGLIDSHDVVIRINGAPAGSDEDNKLKRDVGARTSVRFVNEYGHTPKQEKDQEVCTFLHEPRVGCGRLCWRSPNMCEPGCAYDPLGGCRGTAQDQKEVDWGKNLVFLDHVHGEIAENLLGSNRVTAGFKALAYAISTCERVSVFGFGPDCDGSTGTRYYASEKIPPSSWHAYKDELVLLKELSSGLFSNLPARVKNWIYATNVKLHLPACVQEHKDAKMIVAGFKRFAVRSSLNITMIV